MEQLRAMQQVGGGDVLTDEQMKQNEHDDDGENSAESKDTSMSQALEAKQSPKDEKSSTDQRKKLGDSFYNESRDSMTELEINLIANGKQMEELNNDTRRTSDAKSKFTYNV